jgi:hypothetical protein
LLQVWESAENYEWRYEFIARKVSVKFQRQRQKSFRVCPVFVAASAKKASEATQDRGGQYPPTEIQRMGKRMGKLFQAIVFVE